MARGLNNRSHFLKLTRAISVLIISSMIISTICAGFSSFASAETQFFIDTSDISYTGSGVSPSLSAGIDTSKL